MERSCMIWLTNNGATFGACYYSGNYICLTEFIIAKVIKLLNNFNERLSNDITSKRFIYNFFSSANKESKDQGALAGLTEEGCEYMERNYVGNFHKFISAFSGIILTGANEMHYYENKYEVKYHAFIDFSTKKVKLYIFDEFYTKESDFIITDFNIKNLNFNELEDFENFIKKTESSLMQKDNLYIAYKKVI